MLARFMSEPVSGFDGWMDRLREWTKGLTEGSICQ